MPEIPISFFNQAGSVINTLILIGSMALSFVGLINLSKKLPWRPATATGLIFAVTFFYLAGFFLICWFHYVIYQSISLQLDSNLAGWLNNRLTDMARGSTYSLPLYDASNPPRYKLPLWIENEKYYFWFLCYAVMALIAHFQAKNHRLRGFIHLFFGIQAVLIFFIVNPFSDPLPRFFQEIEPWFSEPMSAMARFGLFMKLYPRLIFYYNAEYMWFHPPMLFLSYAAITITFITSVFMLWDRKLEIEKMGYDYAKFGYFMLTLGMLLGYPWALQAWGPNWWWDPKICSSIMMWAVYSTYLHTRLYANKAFMWYFSSFLGILCFLAMIFTFTASFFFPGEHTMQ